MDIDDLDQILLDDYETFDSHTNQAGGAKATFDPLAPALSFTDGSNVAPPITKRRQLKKLDAELLLSSKGLPRIRKQTPLIKFYGRGHEDTDLRKLMDYYQMWAHNLYPRLQFRDFARNIMKATANPRVRQELRTWQDEHREKMDERARMLAEIEGEEDPFADTNNPQSDKDDSDDDGNDEEAMHEVFMDYLVGVKTGAISIEDAPTTATSAGGSTARNPAASNAMSSKSIMDDDDDDDDDLFMNFVTNVNRPAPDTSTAATTTHSAPSSSSTIRPTQVPAETNSIHDSTDDEDAPLFLPITQKRRRIQVEQDEDMSE